VRARFHVDRTDDSRELAAKLRRSWSRAHDEALPPTDHETIDETALLSGWLRRHSADLVTFALPEAGSENAWESLADDILRAEPRREDWEPDVSEDEDEDELPEDEEALDEEEADEFIVLR
jgi:hypothetical protein